MVLGAVLFLAGGLLWLVKSGHLPFLSWIGHLPLDFKIEKPNFTFYFPLGTSILISVILTILLYFFRKG